MVVDYSKKIRNFLNTEIAGKKKSEFGVGERFSLSFDEWTSIRNRCYMNINLHARSCQFWSLGLIRIAGSMSEDKCIELLEQNLAQHGLDLRKDIVGIMTDGASVMKKVGRILPVNQHLCFAHGVQLAVYEVLYQKQNIEREIDQQFDEDEQSDIEDDFSESNYCEDDNFSENNELADLDASHNRHRGNQCDDTEVSCGPVIKKVRKLIVMFRRSPKKTISCRSILRLNLGSK